MELGGHGVAGLNGDHLSPALTQQSGGDSGARADIGDAGTGQGTARELFDAVEERGRIRRPAGRVLVSRRVKRMGA